MADRVQQRRLQATAASTQQPCNNCATVSELLRSSDCDLSRKTCAFFASLLTTSIAILVLLSNIGFCLFFPQITPGHAGLSKKKPSGLLVRDLIQAGCPSCHPINSIKTLKGRFVNTSKYCKNLHSRQGARFSVPEYFSVQQRSHLLPCVNQCCQVTK